MTSILQTSQNFHQISNTPQFMSTTMTHSVASSSTETIPQIISPVTAHQLNNAIPQKLKFNKLRTNLELKLVEPVIFFRGKPEEAVGCVLRGDLILNLAKDMNVRRLEMKFVGKTQTHWREGKDRRSISEEREVISHTWKFIEPSTKARNNNNINNINNANNPINTCRIKLLRNKLSSASLNSNSSTYSSASSYLSPSTKLPAGTHTYPFELYLPGNLPETTNTELGTVKYYLKAKAYRTRLSPKIHLSHEVEILRTLPDHINSQGIGFSREFNDLLSYEINIPKKAYPLGQQIPIDMKIAPYIKKLKVTGVSIQVVEKTTYTSCGQKVTDSRLVAIQNSRCMKPVHYSCTTPLISVAHDLKFSFMISLPRSNTGSSYEDDSFYCPCHPEYLRMARLVLGESGGNRLDNNCRNGINDHNRNYLNVQRNHYNRAPPSYEDSVVGM